MKQEEVIVVDDQDNVIGPKYRAEVDFQKDIYRSSGIWITDSQDRILIAQRTHTKAKDPDKWGPSVAGTVNWGETYEENAYKELAEELGVTGCPLILGPKQYIDSPRKQFYQWFFCVIDKEAELFSIQEEEVESVAWVRKDDLIADIRENPEKYVAFMAAALTKSIH